MRGGSIPELLETDLESGLICGFAVGGDGALTPVGWREMDGALAAAGTEPGKPQALWLHFNAADRHSQHFIANAAALPPDVRGFILEHDNRARFEPMDGGFAAAFPDIRVGVGDDPTETGMVRMWCNARVFVTARTVPLATLDGIRRTIRPPRSDGGAFDFLLALLFLFQGTFARLIAELDVEFGRVEDAILAERFLEQRGELGRLRRRMVHLRRLIHPQQHALHAIKTRPPPWLDGGAREAVEELSERLASEALDLEHMLESARLLQDEQASRLAELTNRNLYFLAILTAIFLPMTLVTGVFGMNVAGLPGVGDDPIAFWWVSGSLAATGIASLLFLRWRGML